MIFLILTIFQTFQAKKVTAMTRPKKSANLPAQQSVTGREQKAHAIAYRAKILAKIKELKRKKKYQETFNTGRLAELLAEKAEILQQLAQLPKDTPIYSQGGLASKLQLVSKPSSARRSSDR